MSGVRPRRLLALLLAVLMMTSLVGACGSTTTSSSGPSATATPGAGAELGSCPTTNTKNFAKTRFVGHAALAFGAFHRYLYKPFRAGTFSSGHHGRFLGLVKAVAAAVYIKHEVRLAAEDVQADPALCRDIAQPIRSFYDSISGITKSDTSGIAGAQTSLDSVISVAKSHGASIIPNNNASIG